MLKSLSPKQAERWLERLKQTNPGAYRELGRCLKNYDQNSDEYECFVKMNEALYGLPAFAQQINGYMEDGNKFLFQKSLKQKLNTFLESARKIKYDLFREIVVYVNKITNEDRQIFELPNKQALQIFKTGLLQIVKNNPILFAEAEKIVPESQQDALKLLDLRHLRSKYTSYEKQQAENNKQIPLKKIKKQILPLPEVQNEKIKESSRLKVINPPNFLTTGDQKTFIKQHEKRIGTVLYHELIKILELYHHNIITRFQFCELIEPIVGVDLAGFKDIIQSRQTDRRKSSTFKPLCDINFHILPRQTHSYVEMPSTYPHFAANRSKNEEEILNNKWVSVPRGSEVTFNVRVKNGYEILLNKYEDQRYQFHLLLMRLKKFVQICKSIIRDLQIDETKNVVHKIKTIISLGVVQLLYRNLPKDSKQIFGDALTNNPLETIKIWLRSVEKYTQEYSETKLYGMRNWVDVAQKNFYKSLDFKNHQFKNSEKNKMKPQTFIEELNYNVKFLQSRGAIKINQNPFEGKKQFFSILNSFQSSSRKERCLSRQIPTPLNYNLTEHKFPNLLPAMIMAFEDQEILLASCSLVYFYIEAVVVNEAEKFRCKLATKQIMSKIFKLKALKIFSLNSNFDEDKFINKLQIDSEMENVQSWVDTKIQSLQKAQNAYEDPKIPFFNSMQDTQSQYKFQPPKSENNVVFYASEHFYTFLRFFYSLYERLIRMRQIASEPKKLKLFEVLYFVCIRSKQSNRFQDGLNSLFKEYAYLFTTFYKIIEGATKSLNLIGQSPLQNYSMSLLSMKNQQVYLLLLNRFMLNVSTATSRLIRITYQLDSHLLYIHSFNPYYRFNEEPSKQSNKKRAEISRNVEAFNLEAIRPPKAAENEQIIWKNYQQYYFQSTSNKLINLPSFEDVVLGERSSKVNLKGEIQKLKKLQRLRK